MSVQFEIPEQMSREKAIEIKHALAQLIDSAGWKYYIGVVQKQQVLRFDEVILVPLSSMDEAFAQEFKKGELAGMRTAVALPAALIENLQMEIDAHAEVPAAEGDHDEQA